MASIVQNTGVKQAQQTKGFKEMPVGDSSFIQNIKYDETNFQLTVTMKNGAEYTHHYVYPQIVDNFFQSNSKGSFYANAIKGKHPSTRVIDKNIGHKGVKHGKH